MDRIFHGKRETAAMLGISVRTLENLIAMREISPRHIGRRVLFDEKEIERFARRDHRTKAQSKGTQDHAENLDCAEDATAPVLEEGLNASDARDSR